MHEYIRKSGRCHCSCRDGLRRSVVGFLEHTATHYRRCLHAGRVDRSFHQSQYSALHRERQCTVPANVQLPIKHFYEKLEISNSKIRHLKVYKTAATGQFGKLKIDLWNICTGFEKKK